MYILLILLVMILSVILFFYPNVISSVFKYDYPYTYENLQEKKDTIERNNGEIMMNETTISSRARDLETTEERRETIYEQAREVKSGIRDEDFVMDMPSFLISMEQKAYKEKVTLIIDYASITTTASGGMSAPGSPGGPDDFDRPDRPDRPGGPDDFDRPGGRDDFEDMEDRIEMEEEDLGQGGPMNNPDEDLDELRETEEQGVGDARRNATQRRNNERESDEQEPAPRDEENSEEEGLGDIMQISGGEVTIQGLDVTTIPIKIEGTFSRVRSYLRYLDEIGMIEPSAIKMSSDGKKVEAGVILNVFHGEVID